MLYNTTYKHEMLTQFTQLTTHWLTCWWSHAAETHQLDVLE